MATRKYGRKASEKVEKAMHEMKRGELKSGRSGRKVTNPKQAVAIGLSEARSEGGKVPAPKAKKSKSSSAKKRASSPKRTTAKKTRSATAKKNGATAKRSTSSKKRATPKQKRASTARSKRSN
ncbi:MAG: DUF6496 domain-containing protein [Polyangiaceae bacterium]